MMTSVLHGAGKEPDGEWAAASTSETENGLGTTFACAALEEQDCQHQEDMEMRSTGSHENDSSGNDFNGHESSGNDSNGHESNGNVFNGHESSGNYFIGHESSMNDFNGHESSGTDSKCKVLKRRSSCTFRRPSKSTGGSSSNNSEPSDRNRSHKELMFMVQEMKRRLPSEKLTQSKPSTVDALNYALKCVRQVQANSQFFQVLSEKGPSPIDLEVHTIEELENITSEHPPKNTDTFVVVFSLTSGKLVYASEQATSILNCKKEFLDSSRFVELLAPQDVSVFYKHTTQSHLQPWNMGTDTAPSLYEYTQVKSFFCRIRGGKDGCHDLQYFPFRITPYSVRVCTSLTPEVEPCCLALAERIHSGYEAPRIPVDKWIFTTTHTPGCCFLEVDDRAVPLLGYLPQDLIGTSVLMYLHSEDRPLMLAMHRKIMKYAGQQPFEHAPMRFCTKNGDYITLDTSWSSFVNPWSRKVAFIIGRHKVRTGPLNEDVFAARSTEFISNENEIRELQGQIYKLLLQPVHHNGSSGYGSFGSNGSYEHYISIASSSDSNGNGIEERQSAPMTLQQVCVDVNRIKNLGQQVYIESRSRRQGKKGEGLQNKCQRGKAPTTASYFPLAIGLPEGQTTSSCDTSRKGQHIPSYQQINCVDSIIRYLESYSIPARKRKSISSINTSSSSQEGRLTRHGRRGSKTLEDGSPAPTPVPRSKLSARSMGRSEARAAATVVGAPITDLTLSIKAMSVVSDTSKCSYSSTIVHVPHPESEVTALEDVTVGSEQIEARSLTTSIVAPEEFKQVGLTKEVLSAHTQKEEQDYVDRFRLRILETPYSSYLQHGNQSKDCSHELGDHSSKQTKPTAGKKGKKHGKRGKNKRQKPQESSDSNGSNQNHQPRIRKLGPVQQSWPSSEVSPPSPSTMAFPQPMMIPIPPAYPVPGFQIPSVTTLTGDCATSSIGPKPTPSPNIPYVMHSYPPFPATFMGPVMAVMLPNYPMYSQMGQQIPQPIFGSPYPCSSSYSFTAVPVPTASMQSQAPPDVTDLPSQVSSPMPQESQQEAPGKDPPLFSNSRSSSPLQLNLLQEELPKSMEPQDAVHNEAQEEITFVDAAEDSGNNDSHSASSELLDLLLQEDSQSGTGSAGSGSGSAESSFLGSGSNGCSSHGTSGSVVGSRNSSKYFASNDSSNTSQNSRKRQQATTTEACSNAVEDPMWTLIKHTSTAVLMTYQVPNRDKDALLKEDLRKLSAMRKVQPLFTEGQKEELAEVHPWIRNQTIPQEIDVDGCIICNRTKSDCEAVAISTSNPEGKERGITEVQHPLEGPQEHQDMQRTDN
ncbi:period circadian protein homolog 3 isoform X2 [Ambystoma mexicanum]|uniref:period circadian protein homolog 3 isoform X2 n=1 Tax=Ambystoma mexicanum TaxID=8296 RepID=UPI0037E82923